MQSRNLVIKSVTWAGLLLISAIAFGLYLAIRRKIQSDPEGVIRFLVSRSPYKEYENIIVAQAKHETGNFTSYNYINRNNLFGMKKPDQRTFSASGVDPITKYLIYRDNAQSISDFIEYLKAVRFPKNLGVNDYVSCLKANKYFTAPTLEYLNGVKNYLKK